MAEPKQSTSWIPLESNPQVMNTYTNKLGVTSKWAFTDVWGLDEELLQFIPRPVLAVVLLFPITEKYEDHRRSEEAQIKERGQTVSKNVYFIRQTIGNACGTIGLLHALANNVENFELGDGPLKRILDETLPKSPDDRAKVLEGSNELAAVHEESSQAGQTAAPSRDQDVDLHFICFVRKDGHLYELDGRKPFPINHGPSDDVLKDSVKIVQQFMGRDPDNLNFTVIALAPAQD
ncbi:uncharacterized protein EV422DRAFT_545935 [Fimicolochytrium jonesii]|uniref:uncharacterized protein n=1 Tax=Fimicolochytrium jonesii TaxID=1396493 RepID=UPI0022FE9E35|nr:uncharacterized protein EV422DRAFT_545935 [Fimicolochytrium jonesii]KAI8816418.1 hypothetical protein EV422DRAFT_545935 [Fimicolochytrium jonesii]